MKFELPAALLPAALMDTLRAARRLIAPPRPGLPPAGRFAVEPLEPRRMLTRLSGGGLVGGFPVPETFEFQSPGGAVRVVLDGNIEAELIGATVDARGVPTLNQVPGIIDTGPRAGTDLFGGFGGADGVEPVHVAFPDEFESFTTLDTGVQSRLRALAVNAAGRTYAFNSRVQTVGETTTVNHELVSLNRANGDGTVVDEDLEDSIADLFPSAGNDDLGPIVTADFSPDDPSLLYFVASVRIDTPGGGDGDEDEEGEYRPFLFTYDLDVVGGDVTLLPGNFQSVGENPTEVYAITFNDAGDLVAFVNFPEQTVQIGDDAEDARAGLVTFDPTGPEGSNGFGQVSRVGFDGGQLEAVTSIEVIPGQPDFVYAVVEGGGTTPAGGGGEDDVFDLDLGGDGARLARIDLTVTGDEGRLVAEDFGNLPDPDQGDAENRRGENLAGLAWHPTIPNPFRLQDADSGNDTGALVATDVGTNELVFVDDRRRFPETELYSVIVTDSDRTGRISIARVPDRDADDREMQPFAGSAGTIRVVNARTGRTLDVSPAAGTGDLFLGLRLEGDGIDEEDVNRPVLSIPSDTLGDAVPGFDLPDNLEPGVTIRGDMDRFLFGGTISGRVNSTGSIDTFYAGQILTGDTSGAGGEATDNFAFRGDLRNLFSFGPIGTTLDDLDRPTYRTGFELAVGGTVGQVVSRGSILGTGGVLGLDAGVSKIVSGMAELETSFAFETGGEAFEAGLLQDARFDNDTFDTPQYVGSGFSRSRGFAEQAQLFGNISNVEDFEDEVDYFAAGLLAGQTVEVELVSALFPDFELEDGTFSGSLTSAVGVFDPEGRLVATDTAGGPFRFTAAIPGDYRFAVAIVGDIDFNGAGGTPGLSDSYELRLSRLAAISLGGWVAAGGDVLNDGLKPLRVFNGDLGAIVADGEIQSFAPITVNRGNLRAVVGEELGRTTSSSFGPVTDLDDLDGGGGESETPGGEGGGEALPTTSRIDIEFVPGPTLDVPRGSVGLLRATDAAGVLSVNDLLTSNGILLPAFTDPDFPEFNFGGGTAVGGDYQLVDAAGVVTGSFVANGGLGVVRGGQNVGGTTQETAFVVNADGAGEDGVIDLIDSGGDLGALDTGGPFISTGPGGNVRYIRVAGIPYRDPRFGGGSPERTIFSAGETVRLTDDSGAEVTIRPTAVAGVQGIDPAAPVDPVNPNFPVAPNPGATVTDFLTITTYPIFGALGGTGGGGQVIVDVTSTGGATIDAEGGPGSSAEIGQLNLLGDGTPVFEVPALATVGPNGLADRFDRINDRLIVPTSEAQLASFYGTPVTSNPGTGTSIPPIGGGGSTADQDLADDDLVNENIDNLFEIFLPLINPDAGNFSALPQLRAEFTGSARLDVLRIDGEEFTSIINETDGEIVTVDAASVGTLRARLVGTSRPRAGATRVEPIALVENGVGVADFFPFVDASTGIVANRIAEIQADSVGNVLTRADLGRVTADFYEERTEGVFEGIAGPIFSQGNIGSVDIGRGILPSGTGDAGDAGLYSENLIGDVTNRGLGSDVRGNIIAGQGIRSIRLDDGAIIGAQISVINDLADSRIFNNTAIGVVSPQNPVGEAQGDIREVTLNGAGGILGALFNVVDLGPVTVNGGFGIINTAFNGLADGVFQPIVTDGLGIRSSFIDGGAVVEEITARGDGNLLDVNAFTPSVLQSATARRDGTTGRQTDPFSGFALSPNTDLHLYLGTSAEDGSIGGLTNSGVIENTVSNASRELGLIRAYAITSNPDAPAGLFGIGGSPFLSNLSFGNEIDRIEVAGPVVGLGVNAGGINRMTVGGDIFAADLTVGGELEELSVGGSILNVADLGGTSITANGPNGRIGRIAVNGDVFAPITATVRVEELLVGRDLLAPRPRGLFSNGPIRRLSVGRDVLSGSLVRAVGSIDRLFVGDDVEAGALIVAGRFGEQQILGSVDGTITTG